MWDERYSETGFAYGTEPNDFLKDEYKRIPKGGHVLCLAEGEGRNAVFLARRGYQVTAVDQSRVGLEKAKSLAKEHGVEIDTVVADLAEYDLGIERWDGVVSIFAHVPPDLRAALHPRIAASLKRGGVLILEAYIERHLQKSGIGGPPPGQEALFGSLDELNGDFADLDIQLARETDRHISEGKYHQGESAVVQFIARKP